MTLRCSTTLKVFIQGCLFIIQDYFCQEGWDVAEDNSCRRKDGTTNAESDDWVPKNNFIPIKAPGNQCTKEYEWITNHDSPSKSIDDGFRISILKVESETKLCDTKPQNTDQVTFAV